MNEDPRYLKCRTSSADDECILTINIINQLEIGTEYLWSEFINSGSICIVKEEISDEGTKKISIADHGCFLEQTYCFESVNKCLSRFYLPNFHPFYCHVLHEFSAICQNECKQFLIFSMVF